MTDTVKRAKVLRTFSQCLHNQRKGGNVDHIRQAVSATAHSVGLQLSPDQVSDECCQKIAHVSHDPIKVNDYVVVALVKAGADISL